MPLHPHDVRNARQSTLFENFFESSGFLADGQATAPQVEMGLRGAGPAVEGKLAWLFHWDEVEDGLWREEKLTIGILANHLGTQEHRLRRTINRVMGYRNFAAFINGYRITAAKQELTNPDNAEKAILSIAYDVGFASIGPFKQAFRLATGVSLSEYRRNAIGSEFIR